MIRKRGWKQWHIGLATGAIAAASLVGVAAAGSVDCCDSGVGENPWAQQVARWVNNTNQNLPPLPTPSSPWPTATAGPGTTTPTATPAATATPGATATPAPAPTAAPTQSPAPTATPSTTPIPGLLQRVPSPLIPGPVTMWCPPAVGHHTGKDKNPDAQVHGTACKDTPRPNHHPMSVGPPTDELRHALQAWLRGARHANCDGALLDTDGNGAVDSTLPAVMSAITGAAANPHAGEADLLRALHLAQVVAACPSCHL